MRELKQNYTIVIVTHNMQQAARVSDYTAFMTMGEDVARLSRRGGGDASSSSRCSSQQPDQGLHHRPVRLGERVPWIG